MKKKVEAEPEPGYRYNPKQVTISSEEKCLYCGTKCLAWQERQQHPEIYRRGSEKR